MQNSAKINWKNLLIKSLYGEMSQWKLVMFQSFSGINQFEPHNIMISFQNSFYGTPFPTSSAAAPSQYVLYLNYSTFGCAVLNPSLNF